MSQKKFEIISDYIPSGDQPQAIKSLANGILDGKTDQVLLGVTGSGKTFTMANVIAELNKPALIMVPNKTLTAQIYDEMKEIFPNNAVECFMSYYDYYQPEAYMPNTDTYIEKDASINERIECLRHSATISLLERRDVIVVASVSAIYGLGDKEAYSSMTINVNKGDKIDITLLQRRLVDLQYDRNDIELKRGIFQVRGDTLDLHPSHTGDCSVRIEFFGNEIDGIFLFDTISGVIKDRIDSFKVFPMTHYVASEEMIKLAVKQILEELEDRSAYLRSINKNLEAHRLEQRTKFDVEMMTKIGTCKGIENYSRYFSRQSEGEPPPTLFDYFPKDSILFIDESHVTVPQIRGMYNGDRARKTILVEHGFRLPSAFDNRPMRFEEWQSKKSTTIYVSATPGPFELECGKNLFVEQVVRPTWIVEPEVIIKPAINQVDDLIHQCKLTAESGYRSLITTLTKKMAENLTEYMQEAGIAAVYMHSDINAIDRTVIIKDLRAGKHDVLIGVNLLREGLDIPECALVGILDADKEGFLRSRTSLIQTIGRAARNINSRVILYADKKTDSMKQALNEIDRRRRKQQEYNKNNNKNPISTKRTVHSSLISATVKDASIKEMQRMMHKAAEDLDFELARELRDKIKEKTQSKKI